MDLFDKFKKINDEKNADSENHVQDNNPLEENDAWDSLFGEEIEYDFKYLSNLIDNSSGEIGLISDIALTDSDVDLNFNEFTIDKDDIVIDGNGHEVDGKNRYSSITVRSKNVTIKNIIFRNFSKIVNGLFSVFPDCKVKIINCEFHNLKGQYGLAFMNHGFLEISDSKFYDCLGSEEGGVVNVQKDSSTTVSNCEFHNNGSRQGGVFMNWGSLKIEKSIFKNNSATEGGGVCVNERGATLNVVGCEFHNTRTKSALANLGDSRVVKSKFIANSSDNGGAIFNFQRKTVIRDCEFINNSAPFGNAISNSDLMEIYNSVFSGHSNPDADVIFNTSNLKAFDLNFKDNYSRTIIFNSEKSSAVIDDCVFMDNGLKNSAIFNQGDKCEVTNPFFENNIVDDKYAINIFNVSVLDLQSPKIKDENAYKSILNTGTLNVKGIEKENIERFIYNDGTVNYLDFKTDDGNAMDFSYLEELLISGAPVVSLDEDIVLNNPERGFYEGGIELNRDNLIIDGNNHSIDARGLSRIFHITGRNITIKNLVFKNGSLNNDFDKYVHGGGALCIVKDASVSIQDCRFENNVSNDLGGAIFNNGRLVSNGSVFDSNGCENYGGAIYNRGCYSSHDDSFESNSSRCGGAIYNSGEINSQNMTLLENFSQISQPIFNCGIIECNDKTVGSIYDVGFVNHGQKGNSKSFRQFSDEIADSREIDLCHDVIFDYTLDSEFKTGINIDSDDNLTVNGNGHSIDANGMAGLLNITSNKTIVFKDIIFKNGFSLDNPLIGGSYELIFENCRFINNKSLNRSVLIKVNKVIKIKNCIFSNNFSKGDLIHQMDSDLEISGTIFISNFSQNSLLNNEIEKYSMEISKNSIKIQESEFIANNSNNSMIHNDCIAEIIGCDFLNNISESKESLIYNSDLRDNSMKVYSSTFSHACAKNTGGVFTNEGRLEIFSSQFSKTHSKYGGAIYNGINGILKLDSCEFSLSSAQRGGALSNLGNVEVCNSKFHSSHADQYGSVIDSLKDSSLKISGCEFFDNELCEFGLIFILGNLDISDSEFDYNQSDAIFKGDSADVNVDNCSFDSI